MKNVEVSVVIPLFNVERYVSVCLDSVISQTLKDIEVICIDDGSTDGSLDVLQSYAVRDSRVKVLTQENRGPGVARNRALDMARGKWIAFMDPDDFYPADYTLEHMVTAAETNDVKIAGGSLRRIVNGEMETDFQKIEKGYLFDKDGVVAYKDYQFDYGYWRFIYERKFLDDHSIRFPDYRRQQDPPLMVKAFSLAGHFFAMQEPTYVYRREIGTHPAWNSQTAAGFFSGIRDVVKLANEFKLDKLYFKELERLVANWFTNAVVEAGKYPEVREAVIDLVDAILKSPFYASTLRIDERFLSLYESRDTGVVVSVIVPVYNVERFLPKCLDSILNQTYPWLEVLCVDDGSTDSSADILVEYAKKDSRVKVLTKPNGGLSSARNFALPHARGRYLMFVDSDDYIAPATIDHAVARMCNDTDLVCWGAELVSEGISRDDPFFVAVQRYHTIKYVGLKSVDQAFMESIQVTVWNKLFKTSIVRAMGFTFAEGLLFEDNDFTFVYMSHCRKAFCLDEYNYFYTQRPGSIMQRFCKGECVESIDLVKVFDRLYRQLLRDGLLSRFSGLLKKRFDIQFTRAIDRTPMAYRHRNLEVAYDIVKSYGGEFGEWCRSRVLEYRKRLKASEKVRVLIVANGCGNKITGNTFVATLAKALEKAGADVECSVDGFWNSKIGEYNVVHLQWPEAIVNWKGENATEEFVARFRRRLNDMKKAGTKIVYTRHNRCPHRIVGEGISELTKIFETEVDAVVHMGEASKHECLLAHSGSPVRHVVIAHHLKDEIDFSVSREDARRKLDIDPDAHVMLAFGSFRHPEEISLVQEAAKDIDIPRFTLLAPMCPGDNYKGIVPDEDLPVFFAAADIVFLQRVKVLNSGVLPLAYDAGRVCVGADDGNVGEILSKTGNPVFNPCDAASVKDAIRRGFALSAAGRGSENRLFARANWTPGQIAERHLELYRELMCDSILVDGFIEIVDDHPMMRNWGDELNWYLLKHLTTLPLALTKDVEYKRPSDMRLLFIGSGSDGCRFDNRSVVWGAGSLYEAGVVKYRPRRVCAVRGPLTREKFVKAGIPCPEIYGDPALLLPKIYRPKIEKRYKLGVAIHFREWYLPHVEEFRRNHPEILFIDLGDYTAWTDIPDKVVSCEALASSSLHAIIVADAYQVPNVFVKFSNLVKGGTWKFRDYYAGVSRQFVAPLDFSKTISLDAVQAGLKSYCPIRFDADKFLDAAPFSIAIRPFSDSAAEGACQPDSSREALLRRARLSENEKSKREASLNEAIRLREICEKNLARVSAARDLAQRKFESKSMEFDREHKKLTMTQTALNLSRREVASLSRSTAYRVGMFVTWPARRVYRMLKCYRENGLKYTLRRLVLGKGRGRG